MYRYAQFYVDFCSLQRENGRVKSDEIWRISGRRGYKNENCGPVD